MKPMSYSIAAALCFLALLTLVSGIIASSADDASVSQMYNFAKRAAKKWQAINTSAGGTYTPAQLAATVGIESTSPLNILIEDNQYVHSSFQQAYDAGKFEDISAAVHIHETNESTRYLVAGYPVAGFEVEPGEASVTFFDGLPLKLVVELEKTLDGDTSNRLADNKGRVRYFQHENGLYLVGIYLPEN